MGELPRVKALVQRHADRPFAVLGINTDRDRDEYRARRAEYGVTWRDSWQGSTHGDWPVGWGVEMYPTTFVLDAEQRIRAIGVRGDELARVVDELLDELESR